MVFKYDFLIIGAGVAGMSYALKVGRAHKGKVCIICKTSLDEANTSFAQGGVASVTNLAVDNFDKHIRHAEGFHRRWMGSNEAKRRWCERVSQMEIDMLCPQHGAIYQGADVQRFINWFDELQVGIVNG